MRTIAFFVIALLISGQLFSQSGFNGLDMNMGNIFRLSDAKNVLSEGEHLFRKVNDFNFDERKMNEIAR